MITKSLASRYAPTGTDSKTGNPNAPGFPEWPAYYARTDQWLELGRTIRVRPVGPQLQVLEQIMQQVFAEEGKSGL